MEVEMQKNFLENNQLDTLYFGGGTPSILELAQLEYILETIRKYFRMPADMEITLEANPEDLTPYKLKGLKDLGINRLSIGIQSFNDTFLKWLNRIHDASKAIEAVKNSRKAGFENISIDLIFAIPYEHHSIWKHDVAAALELTPDHVSAYHLTIEPNTVFGNWLQKKKIDIADDQFAAWQFEHLFDEMSAHGYEAYEISNYARNGKISKHNSNYWFHKPYLGLGPGAHSFDGQHRHHNIYNNPKYIKSIQNGQVPMVHEKLSPTDVANEMIMTGLRTKWGLQADLVKEKCGIDLMVLRERQIQRLIDKNMLYKADDRLYLTREGRLFADSISSELFIGA